jgi:hypothetical protein
MQECPEIDRLMQERPEIDRLMQERPEIDRLMQERPETEATSARANYSGQRVILVDLV